MVAGELGRGHRVEEPIAASCSELPKEEQDYQNDNNDPDDSTGSVPPAPAVPPGWQHAQQSQYENDEKDGADTHFGSLAIGFSGMRPRHHFAHRSIYCPFGGVHSLSADRCRQEVMSTTEQTPVGKYSKLLPAGSEQGSTSGCNETLGAYLVESLMESRMNQAPRGSVNSGRFEALLDKLVAVEMELEPICGVARESAQVVASLDAIADACDVLRSAIADVRNIIHQVNGLTQRPEAVFA